MGVQALWLDLDTDRHEARSAGRSRKRRRVKKNREGGEEPEECRFGWSVALSADGSTALLGDPHAHGGEGAAWVFTRAGETWSRSLELTPRSRAERSLRAQRGALGRRRDGARGRAEGSTAGRAWVFTRTGSTAGRRWAPLTRAARAPRRALGAAWRSRATAKRRSSVGLPTEGRRCRVGVRTRRQQLAEQGAKLTGARRERRRALRLRRRPLRRRRHGAGRGP